MILDPLPRKREFQNNKGFTLVELAIVLVIIGLLIGGILAAQSMISNAKIKRLISEVQQYNTMIVLFKSQYNYWPGDYPQNVFGVSPSTTYVTNGNGDGIVWNLSYPTNGLATELINTWWQLEVMGFLVKNKLSHATTDLYHNTPLKYFPRDSVPGLEYNKTASLIFGSANNAGDIPLPSGWDNYTPAIYIAGTMVFPWSMNEGVIKPSDASAIDIKIDDGIYDSGSMFSFSAAGGAPAEHHNCIANLGGWRYNYEYKNDLHGCRMVIKLTNY